MNTDSGETLTAEGGAANTNKAGTTHHEIHLPPIDPPTPSVGNARKFLNKGAIGNLQNSSLLSSVMKDLPEQQGKRVREGTMSPILHGRTASDGSTDQEMNGSQGDLQRNNSTASRLDSPRSVARSEQSLPDLSPRARSGSSGSSASLSPRVSPRGESKKSLMLSESEPSLSKLENK